MRFHESRDPFTLVCKYMQIMQRTSVIYEFTSKRFASIINFLPKQLQNAARLNHKSPLYWFNLLMSYS